MSTKDDYDQFAADMVRRFEDFTTWAKENWPDKQSPLLDSDFASMRKEVAEMVGPRLGEAYGSVQPGPPDDTQYVSVTPMPWP
jgi:hypothetical protein